MTMRYHVTATDRLGKFVSSHDGNSLRGAVRFYRWMRCYPPVAEITFTVTLRRWRRAT